MGRRSLAAERREQITEAYYRCLVKRGLEGCTLANIAEEAGMPKGMLTHYFKNKDEMALELTRLTIEKYEAAYLGRLAAVEDPRERLHEALSIMFGNEFIDDELTRAYIAVLYRATRNDRVRDAMVSMYELGKSYLDQLIMDAAGPGKVDPTEAEQAAVSLIALQDGMSGQCLMAPERVKPSMALEAARSIVDRFLQQRRG